jgi:hypothetical protein
MNIYYLYQNDVTGYDTYDSCVVVAENENEAKEIHPAWYATFGEDRRTWTDDINKVGIDYLGKYEGDNTEAQVICASFNAG